LAFLVVSLIPVAKGKAVCDGCKEEFVKEDWRQTKCKASCSRYRKPSATRFVAIDGEGLGSDPSKYVLLGVGDRQIENANGLDWRDCFEFLYREFERHGRGVAFVGFFLGYDFTQILKTLPAERAAMLLTIKGKAKRKHRVKGKEPHPVECDGWQFDILGMKRLRIRPKRCNCRIVSCKCKKASWMFVCDVGGFWQTSFLNVIDPKGWKDPVVTQEEYDLIRVGKEKRGVADLDDDMRMYNRLENEILARVMDVMSDGFEEIGIHLSPRQWFGPGQASATWMKGKVPKRKEWYENIPEWFTDAARKSYYGGWFETFVHGYIKGDVHEYDINSAYPSIIRRLPCLEHGKYTRGIGKPSTTRQSLCLVKVRVKVSNFGKRSSGDDKRQYIGTMLHRNDDGSICRPAITEGWFWLDEVEASKRAGCIGRISPGDWIEWVNYEPCDCDCPFDGIADLYETRLAVGKSSPLGKGAKLVYNSSYGKFAQSIGEPQFGNPIYASRITSGCREMILDAIATHPDGQRAVAMVATDAVFFLVPHPGLSISNKLGDWDYQCRTNLTIFKPGVYWDDETRRQIREGSKPKFKARGINAGKFAEEIWKMDFWFQSWEVGQENEWPSAVFMTDFAMVTALQALVRNNWETAGKNDPKEVLHNSNPYKKRKGCYWDDQYKVWRSDILDPIWNWEGEDWDCVSMEYKKMFGLDDPFSDETRESLGMTEDGSVGDVFRFLLKNDE
jgi:hypothetical protein